MERREAVSRALLHHDLNQRRIRALVSHELNDCILLEMSNREQYQVTAYQWFPGASLQKSLISGSDRTSVEMTLQVCALMTRLLCFKASPATISEQE